MTEEKYSKIPEEELKALKSIPVEYWELFIPELIVCDFYE